MFASSRGRSIETLTRTFRRRPMTTGVGQTNGAHADDFDRREPVFSPQGAPRVVIADDHPVYRQGLARLLKSSGIDVVGEASNGLAAIELVEKTAPDVAIIDLNMPGLSGVEVARRLVERSPSSRVLIVSVSAQEDDVTEALLAGASGYVLKDAPVEEVIAGIHAAAAGESLLSPRIAATLLDRIHRRGHVKGDESPLPLSDREMQVLGLVAQGRAHKEIGEALFIGAGTVTRHISSLLMKLQVENRIQAAMRTVRHRAQ
jgi:DNA-binding NarL/FixJ family response regulator